MFDACTRGAVASKPFFSNPPFFPVLASVKLERRRLQSGAPPLLDIPGRPASKALKLQTKLSKTTQIIILAEKARNMESYLNLKLEEIRSNIDELFSLLYWRTTDGIDMYEADVETLYEAVEDTLDFLEEKECETQICRIRELVDQMIRESKELLPNILYKIDEELDNLYKCLENIWKNISNDAATADNTTTDDAKATATEYTKIDVNKINLNDLHVNKVDVNKIF